MKIISIIIVFVVLGICLGVQDAYAAEKFVTNQTITYQIQKWTNDDHITNQNLTDILDEAILQWETLNPGLQFEKTKSNPDVVIRWENIPELGVATCQGTCTRSNMIDYTIRISIGDENCLGEFTYMERDFIKRVTVHELGHTLGITHTWDRDSVMYGQIIYDGGYLKPVGFNNYNIPKSTVDWWEGEYEIWYDISDVVKQIRILNDRIDVYNERLGIMEAREVEFKTSFEENRLDIRDVLTEMTIPIKAKMAILEDRLNILQADLDGLNERHEKHTNLYNILKNKASLASVELIKLEKQADDITDSLICFPMTEEKNILTWVGMLRDIE